MAVFAAMLAALAAIASGDWSCPVCGISSKESSRWKKMVEFSGGQTVAIGGDGLFHQGGCVALFNKDPPAYLNATSEDAGTLPPRPSHAGETMVCPVSGETFQVPADEDAHFVRFNHGQVVYVCCAGCVKELKANLTKYITALPNESKANLDATQAVEKK